jgi:hypothetical protein
VKGSDIQNIVWKARRVTPKKRKKKKKKKEKKARATAPNTNLKQLAFNYVSSVAIRWWSPT